MSVDIIEQYSAVAPDYSREFTEKVGRLGEALSAALGVMVRHDDDMNYNAGQRLTVHLGADGEPTSDETKARYVLKAVVSSKGPLWTLLGFARGADPRVWYPLSVREMGESAGRTSQRIAEVLDSAGSRVEDELLDRPVPGQVTELDGAPATVRDVFFCEVC
jgi:hypothetical protein